jgi:protein-L-isoaspartate(D-aspartate) O-methyltransferase
MKVGDDVAPHIARFTAMLGTAFRSYGVKDGLPAHFRDAVLNTPRHHFVHRFRLGDGPLLHFEDDPGQHLGTIYSDKVIGHVNVDGVALPSTNSQPSLVLWLLDMLDLRPGQRVLEIGSGSGWLAAVMAQLVGPDGHVTGIEIIPELAVQSRRDITALGLKNVTILTQDGTSGHAAGAPFDRVMITAATWDLPTALFEQVADGGYALVPIELRGTDICQVTLLRQAGIHFVAERSAVGRFVPLVGTCQERTGLHRRLDSLPLGTETTAAPCVRCKLPLGAFPGGRAGDVTVEFRAFLGRTEPGFTVFERDGVKDGISSISSYMFGIVDEATNSMALCTAGELVGYGGHAAARQLARAYARWAEFGLPGMAAFALEVWCTGASPAGAERLWVESRGKTALVWGLGSDTTAWRWLCNTIPLDETSSAPALDPPSDAVR